MAKVPSSRSTKRPASGEPPKSPPRFKLIIIGGIILLLVGLGLWEQQQRSCYDETLLALAKKMTQKAAAEGVPLTLAEARSLIRGSPVETVEEQNGGKQVQWRWRTLFRASYFRLQLGPGDVVVAVNAGLGQHDARLTTDATLAAGNRATVARIRDEKARAAMLAKHHLVELPYRRNANEGRSKADPQMVLLDVSEPFYRGEFNDVVKQGILVRELGRQALLIAARDELSLPIRDRSLNEAFPTADAPELRPLAVITTIDENQHAQVTVYRYVKGAQGTPPTEDIESFALPLAGGDLISQLATALEPLSRKELVNTLKTAGYSGSARKQDLNGPLPEDLEQNLLQYDIVSQFLILRRICAEIQQHGESVPRLAALARAYAHLGTLSEALWSPAHKVFKARALLYAERLVNKAPEQAISLWSRAYVKALVGLPDAALRDLKRARELDKSRRAPTWLSVIEAFCRSDESQLEAQSKIDSTKVLATYLQLLAADLSTSLPVRFAAAEKMLKVTPDCMRAWDLIARDPRLGVQSRVAAVLDDQLEAMSELPAEIQSLIPYVNTEPTDDLEVRIKRLGALLEIEAFQTDAEEPRLAILRNLIQEVGFVLADGVVRYRRSLGVDTRALIQQVHPIVREHNFAQYIMGYHTDTIQAYRQLQSLAISL